MKSSLNNESEAVQAAVRKDIETLGRTVEVAGVGIVRQTITVASVDEYRLSDQQAVRQDGVVGVVRAADEVWMNWKGL